MPKQPAVKKWDNIKDDSVMGIIVLPFRNINIRYALAIIYLKDIYTKTSISKTG